MSWRPLAVGSKKTMALRQANSVSSKLMDRKGSTSSVITRTPISRTAASWNSKFEYVWQSVLYIINAFSSWLLESRWSRLFPSLWGPWEWSCRCPRVTFRGVSSIFLQHPVTDVRQHERVIAQPRTWKQWLTLVTFRSVTLDLFASKGVICLRRDWWNTATHLVVQRKIAKSRDVFCPIDKDHQLGAHGLADIPDCGQLKRMQ